MKQRLSNLILVLSLLIAQAPLAVHAADTTAKVLVFTGHGRYEHPLSTYEDCNPYTFAGIRAAAEAERDARNQCHDAFNDDCVVVTTTYKPILSQEFIGYKACESTVIVHGYQLNP